MQNEWIQDGCSYTPSSWLHITGSTVAKEPEVHPYGKNDVSKVELILKHLMESPCTFITNCTSMLAENSKQFS